MKSFIMLGQSNMAGRGIVEDVPPIYNERIQMLRNGRWQMMTEPVNYDRPVSGIGPAGSFADLWCLENPGDTIGLIPCAEGGSTLDEWAVDGVLFQHAISEAEYAMCNSELAGILWHQGESDSMNHLYESYYDKLLLIVETLRRELKVPHIPMMIGGLGDFLGQTGYGKSATEAPLVEKELVRFAIEQKNCFYITATGLKANSDGIHFNAESQRIFGIRYYEAFSKQCHLWEPLADEEEKLAMCYGRIHTQNEEIYRASMDLAQGKISYQGFLDWLKS